LVGRRPDQDALAHELLVDVEIDVWSKRTVDEDPIAQHPAHRLHRPFSFLKFSSRTVYGVSQSVTHKEKLEKKKETTFFFTSDKLEDATEAR